SPVRESIAGKPRTSPPPRRPGPWSTAHEPGPPAGDGCWRAPSTRQPTTSRGRHQLGASPDRPSPTPSPPCPLLRRGRRPEDDGPKKKTSRAEDTPAPFVITQSCPECAYSYIVTKYTKAA